MPDTLVTIDDVNAGKPAPDPYLTAAAALGVAADRCLVIEDAPAGITSARAAGAHVLAVTTTHAPHRLAEAHGVVASLTRLDVVADASGVSVRWSGSAPDGADS